MAITKSRFPETLIRELKACGTVNVTLKEMQNVYLYTDKAVVERTLHSGTKVFYEIKNRKVCPGVFQLFLQINPALTKNAHKDSCERVTHPNSLHPCNCSLASAK